MNKAEAIEIIDGYEADFEAIQAAIDNTELTPKEKVAEIQDIISEDEEEEEEEEE